MSIRAHFLRIVIPIVAVIWLLMTVIFAWNDYEVNLASRLSSEDLIAETFISGIRQPLIQGSFLEAKIRSDVLTKSNQVKCVTIKLVSDSIESCRKTESKVKFENSVVKEIFIDEEGKALLGNVSLVFDNSDLGMQFLGRGLRSAIGFAFFAGLLFLALSRGMKPIKNEIDMILTQAKSDPNIHQLENFRISEFSRVSVSLMDNMKAASQVAQVTASLAVARQVGHDIRSPLTSLRLLIDNLENRISSEYYSALKVSSKRISEIANDLIERQEVKFKKYLEVVCAEEICREIISEKKNIYFTKSGIDFNLKNESDNPKVLAFPSDFKRVLSNLIDNSVEASTNGKTINICIRNVGEDLEIAIADQGIGISEENIVHLFKPGATFGKSNGKGLGLAHAKTTIEALGGKIEISSKLGFGTEIKIFLKKVDQTFREKNYKSVFTSEFSAREV